MAREIKEKQLAVSLGEKPRVVFDCMIFLQATASESGPAFKCLQRFQSDEFCLFISQEILDEVRDVLSHPKVRRKLPLLTEGRITALLEHLKSKAILVPNVPNLFRYDRDPKDEKYLNLAVITI